MGLVCIQNSSLLVYSKSQKVSASYCLPFQHSRGKNQPVGGFRPPPPGLFRVKQMLFPKLFGFIKELSNEVYMIHNEMFHFSCRLEDECENDNPEY